MPYSQENKDAAQKFVAAERAKTHCADCGSQPIEWHNPKHEADSNKRVAGLAACGYPIDQIKAEMKASTALCRSCHMKRRAVARKALWAGSVFAE